MSKDVEILTREQLHKELDIVLDLYKKYRGTGNVTECCHWRAYLNEDIAETGEAMYLDKLESDNE